MGYGKSSSTWEKVILNITGTPEGCIGWYAISQEEEKFLTMWNGNFGLYNKLKNAGRGQDNDDLHLTRITIILKLID